MMARLVQALRRAYCALFMTHHDHQGDECRRDPESSLLLGMVLCEIKTALSTIERKLDCLGDKLMAIGTETLKVIQQIDAATTAIAERIAELIANADLTDEEKAAFQEQIDRLTALGSDPANPVPPPA